MSTSRKKHGISLEDIAFYLDGVERDRLDSVGPGGKTSEAIAIRDKLLRLPDDAFNAAIKSMKALVADVGVGGAKGQREAAEESLASGRRLYDESRATGSAGARGTLSKVSRS